MKQIKLFHDEQQDLISHQHKARHYVHNFGDLGTGKSNLIFRFMETSDTQKTAQNDGYALQSRQKVLMNETAEALETCYYSSVPSFVALDGR
jgi:hypothetical protein